MRLLVVLVALACVASGQPRRGNRRGQNCYNLDNSAGQCVPLSSCPALTGLFDIYPPQSAYEYVRAAQQSCGTRASRRGRDRDLVVCCGFAVSPNNPFLPNSASHSNREQEAPGTHGPPILRKPPPGSRNEQLVMIAPNIDERSTGTCTGPDRKIGVCKPLANCESLLRTLQNDPKNEAFIRFLRTSNQICGNEYSVVCCPSLSAGQVSLPIIQMKPTKLPTISDGCGMKTSISKNFNSDDQSVHIQVVGGVTAKPGGWPWIALIGYSDSVSGSPFKCGGTLITDRHVLTAAHCIRKDLSYIRLGEHDLNTVTDGAHIDIPVSKVLKHPQFNRTDGHNDIALLYLSKQVQFNERIGPICLPTSADLLRKSFVNRSAFVAGWGRTVEGGKSATLLQELEITVYANQLCRDLYRKNNKLVSENQFDRAVICAGDIEGGKDSCQGDSGGPLMVAEVFNQQQHYVLVGVVSYGIGCARKETPGVYASVASFMDWILAGVAT